MRNTTRMNGIQKKLVQTLTVKPMTVAELREEIGVSEVYIRQQLNLLEQMGRVEKVDMRQPFIYQPKSIDMHEVERIENIRQGLKDPEKADKLAPFIHLVHKKPKKDWPLMADGLRIIADLITEMEENGELIDTL